MKKSSRAASCGRKPLRRRYDGVGLLNCKLRQHLKEALTAGARSLALLRMICFSTRL